MTLYFAYGANLDRVGMARRCPGSTPLGLAWLDRYRFTVMTAGYATVLPARDGTVHGLLWEIAAADLPGLDDYEEVDAGLYRRAALPVMWNGDRHDAAVYLAAETATGVPRPGYMELVLAAAEDCGLPAPYLAELRTWLAPS